MERLSLSSGQHPLRIHPSQCDAPATISPGGEDLVLALYRFRFEIATKMTDAKPRPDGTTLCLGGQGGEMAERGGLDANGL